MLKLTYRLAEEGGSIKINPARLVKQIKEDNERVRYLSDAEETKLRAVILSGYSDFLPEFEIAMMTGMRMSEQFQREWSDADLEAGTILLAKTKERKSSIRPPEFHCISRTANAPQ